MTDKEKLEAIKKEIESLRGKLLDHIHIESDKQYAIRAAHQFNKLLQFIDSLPEKPVSEDLEEEFNRFLDEEEGVPRMWHSDEQMEWGMDIARHFAEWQREQLMKELWHKGTDDPGNKHPYPVINPDTQEMAFAYYDQRFGLWEFDRDYNPGRNMLWLDIEKILPNLQEGGA